MNFQDLFFAANFIGSKTVLDLAEFLNQTHYRKFLRVGDRLIITDLVIIHTRFGSNQLPFSLQITTIASRTREMSAITPKHSLKKDLTYSSSIFYGQFHADFCPRKNIFC